MWSRLAISCCDQARKARLPGLRPGHSDDGSVGAAHRGEGAGQRCGGGRHHGGEILRSRAAVSSGDDAGARSRPGDRPRHAGWMGDARGRTAAAGDRGDARGSAEGELSAGRRNDVPVQMHDKRGSDHQAYLWQYGKPGGETVFDFCLGRGREGPKRFLGKWEGILQTDGYQAYKQVGGPKMVHVGCWAHARRKFVDAVKVNPQDADAVKMVTRMDALFLVDRDAREQGLSLAERHALRREHGRSVGGRHSAGMSGDSAARVAAEFGWQGCGLHAEHVEETRTVLEYAEVELSNNLAENSMRPVAVGRKNWLHVGSVQAGPKVAAILSVVESCRRLHVPVKEYLVSVLPGLQVRTMREIAGLTPARWQAGR